MCGIAGFVGTRLSAEHAPEVLSRMIGAIAHRGPDESGAFFDSNVGMANARLSIIDIVSGSQPMIDDSGRFVIVYNGEFYNYLEKREELEANGVTFRTNSDTEVFLQLLIKNGIEAFAKVNGQFAVAFYDRLTSRLVLGRDKFGERPLYVARSLGGFAFSSEIKAFPQLGDITCELDPDRLATLFQTWSNVPDQTSFHGIDAIPHGHYAVIERGQLRVHPFFSLADELDKPIEKKHGSEETVGEALKNSIRLRMRSDVPVGTYLSGGIDSTIVTGVAAQEYPDKISTYSVVVEGEEFDESDHQVAVSEYFDTDHHELKVSERQIAESVPQVVHHAENPQFRLAPAPMYLLSKTVKETGGKLVLTGEGADEAFLGYNLFRETLFRERIDGLTAPQTEEWLESLYPYLSHFANSQKFALRSFYVRHRKERLPGMFSHEPRFSLGKFVTSLLVGESNESSFVGMKEFSDYFYRRYEGFDELPSLRKAQIMEYDSLLSGYLLSSQGDRMSSANGVESRSPFFDLRVIRAAADSVSIRDLEPGGIEKQALKKAFRNDVPHTVLNRRKQPYRVPDAISLLSSKIEWFSESCTERSIRNASLFKPEQTTDFIDRIRTKSAREISPRENQALVFIATTQLLSNTAKEWASISRHDDGWRVLLDGRQIPVSTG